MSNVVKLPKKFKPPPVAKAKRADFERVRARAPQRNTIWAVLSVAFLIVRVPAFLVLYWMRLPVVLVCNLVSVPMLFAFLFAWYAFPDKTNMVTAFGVASFLAFAIMWGYDFVLVLLSPDEVIRTL